jgi:hypothetical protein
MADYGDMEGPRRKDAPPPNAEQPPQRRRLFGWLLSSVSWLPGKPTSENGHLNGAAAEHINNGDDALEFVPGATVFHPMVRNAVKMALAEAEEEAKWEAGSPYGRRVWPLLLGPQRYRDPAIYAPPAEARPEIGGTGPDAKKKLPLTEDPHYEETLKMIDDLDARTGWPGDPA